MGGGNIWSLNMLRRTLKGEFTSASLVTNGRKGQRICVISSYPSNHAQLNEYAQNLVTDWATRPAINQMSVLTDQVSRSNEKLP